jgi:hypothetical protein
MKGKDWKTTVMGLIIGIILLLVQLSVIPEELGNIIKAIALVIFGYVASGMGNTIQVNTDWKTTIFGIVGGVVALLTHFIGGLIIPEALIDSIVNIVVAIILFIIALLSGGNEYGFDRIKNVKKVDWKPTVVGIIGGVAIILAAFGIIIPETIVNIVIAISVLVLGYVTTGVKKIF